MLSIHTYDNDKLKKLEKGDKYFININPTWKKNIIGKLLKHDNIELITKQFDKDLEDEATILPYPNYIFNAFKLTQYDNVKVVFIGQDPYHGVNVCKSKDGNEYFVPQATGACFSIPVGVKIPSSLKNIFDNQIKFNHIKKQPNHGNLEEWAKQGCLLLNTALTVRYSEAGCHAKIWSWFTDAIIKHLSEKKNNIVFVLWGKHALEKRQLIDETKHKTVISSHPSGLSVRSKLQKIHPSFVENDHFKQINDYLTENNIEPINWELTDV